ncbi:thiamine diphosphate-binding protein [Xylariales sp. AK1849]|nr:thiamine diphosphate-binding protein [Xylariales sp. AK1849]
MSEIYVGEYLFRRLREIGIETIFGVPGDYELALLDLIPPTDLTWVGSPNELVAAYAADGYARVKGAGALVTTFGPGELSALCGIGGSFTEFVPVLHIVGYPNDAVKKSGKIYHHTLGDKSYDHYVNMSAELSCATAVLKDPAIAADEIDRVLNAMLYHSQPGYIGIPQEVAYSKIPSSGLSTPLSRFLSPNAADVETSVINAIIAKLESSNSPALIVDGGGARGSWNHLADGLVDALDIPYFTTILGKGIVKESSDLFGGSYLGAQSWPSVIKAIEGSDCLLWLGNYPGDFNTGLFTENVKEDVVVDFQRFHTMIGETKHEASMVHVLERLIGTLKAHPTLHKRGSSTRIPPRELLKEPKTEIIKHEWIWQRLTSYFRPGDLIVVETGTSQFGIAESYLPDGSHMWTQAVYGSIGYAAGAAVGGSIAGKESGKYKRMILITGEGSLQLTVQAFALLMRRGIVPVVFIINNNGYTVERILHGLYEPYNDVPDWDYGAIFKAMSPDIKDARTFKVQKASELDKLLSDKEFAEANCPQCVDIAMEMLDLPPGLVTLGPPPGAVRSE